MKNLPNRWVRIGEGGEPELVPTRTGVFECNAAVEFEGETLLVSECLGSTPPLLESWVRLVAWESGELLDWLYGDHPVYGLNLFWLRYIGDRKKVKSAVAKWEFLFPGHEMRWVPAEEEPQCIEERRQEGHYSPEEIMAALGQQKPGEGWAAGPDVELDE